MRAGEETAQAYSEGGLIEPFALGFTLRAKEADGGVFTREITPELLARIDGPHARRAVYGTAFAAGAGAAGARAVADWESVWCYCFGPDGPLRMAFDLPADARRLSMTVETRGTGLENAWVLSPACTR